MNYSIDLKKLRSEFGDEGHIVGFANKYFTMWTYKIVEDVESQEITFDAYFNHNIGAKNPYSDVLPFDENLKGKVLRIVSAGNSDISIEIQKQELKSSKFSKNPMKGCLINECKDLSLLCWKFNSKAVSVDNFGYDNNPELINIKNRAIELGAFQFNDFLFDEDPTAKFSNNPQRGDLISECNDCDLLVWKFNHDAINYYNRLDCVCNGELTNIKNRAVELGAVELSGRLYSPKHQQEEWFVENINIKSCIENGQSFEANVKTNISVEGYISMGFNQFLFEKIQYHRENYYCPFEHSMPIDNKGKAKRIKGKKILINKYEEMIDEQGRKIYKITDWEVVKQPKTKKQ